MDLACLPAAVRDDMARASVIVLPSLLTAKLREWERLDAEERERAAADVALMARLAAR